MARVVGVDIPNNKRLEIALTYIFGVGRTTASKVCKELNLDPGMKARDLTEEQVTTLANHLNKNYSVEGQLRRQLAASISRLRDIGCYRGIRHRRSLPVRGQRTRTNARTRKGVKKTAPVNMTGAVSPVVRETSRITPVRMPLTAFGSTTRRMVCQRVAPMFQQASRKAKGTACRDSRVATMTTGRVMMARVMLAARMLVPKPKKMTKAPTPKRAWTMEGTPARLMMARLITRVNQLSGAYSLR